MFFLTSDHPCPALFFFLTTTKERKPRLSSSLHATVTSRDADQDHRRRQCIWSTVNLAFPFFSDHLLTSTYKTSKPYKRGPSSEGWVMRKLQNGAKEQQCLMYTGKIQFCDSHYFPFCVCPSHTSFPRLQGLWLSDWFILSYHRNQMHQ